MKGWQLGWALAFFGIRAVFSAGVITALIVLAIRPVSAAVWSPIFVALILLIGYIDIRQQQPGWLVWIRGRPRRD